MFPKGHVMYERYGQDASAESQRTPVGLDRFLMVCCLLATVNVNFIHKQPSQLIKALL